MTARLWALIGTGAVIALLIGVVLWQRNSLTAAEADAKAKKEQISQLTEANKSQLSIINSQAQARIDNDAIADLVASRVGAIKVRETNTQTIIKEAKQNDPATRDWSSVPVPRVVQNAINTADPISAPAR